MRTLLLALALALSLFAVPSCFKVDEPPCSYLCADDGKCPENYVCASDGYCHRNDYAGECTFGDDVDQSTGSVSNDLSVNDLTSID